MVLAFYIMILTKLAYTEVVQYAATLGLNIDKINKDPQRISKIKPFMDQYNWKDIDFHLLAKTGESSN